MDFTDTDLESIRDQLSRIISKNRMAHSLRTAETARDLSALYGTDPAKAYLAGLVHDVAREMTDSEIRALVERDEVPLYEGETRQPVLLHGRASAVYVKEVWGIVDPEILEAVRFHTLGAPGIGPLAKVLFVADYIEPGREHVDRKFRNRVVRSELDRAVMMVYDRMFVWLESQGMDILDCSREFYTQLKGGLNRG